MRWRPEEERDKPDDRSGKILCSGEMSIIRKEIKLDTDYKDARWKEGKIELCGERKEK